MHIMTNIENLLIESKNGLGDQVLDIIGVTVLSNILNINAYVIWCNQSYRNFVFGNGVYDYNMIDFSNVPSLNIFQKREHLPSPLKASCIEPLYPSATLSPYSIWKWLQSQNMNFDIEKIIKSYYIIANKIKPKGIDDMILDKNELKDVIAIHVRCTDKIMNSVNSVSRTVENTPSEYITTWNTILENTKKHKHFFVCSENLEMRDKMIQEIKVLNPNAEFVMYNNNNNDLQVYIDLFTMSRCKEIHQCTFYSTFSLLASLIGNKPLINYSKNSPCLINAWTLNCMKCNIYSNNCSECN